MKNLLLIFSIFCMVASLKAQNSTFAWAAQIGSNGIESGGAMVVDASGNVYVSGTFNGKVDFDPATGASDTFYMKAQVFGSGFVLKLDASGNFLWAKGFVDGDVSDCNSIAIDPSNGIYVGGNFNNTVDFDPGEGPAKIFNLTAVGSYDAFIVKLDESGNFVWAKQLGGSDYQETFSIGTDGSGNVYASGIFNGTADFDPGAGAADTLHLTSAGGNDIFVVKLNQSGDLLWAKRWGGSNRDAASMVVDGSGNVYTTGGFTETIDFDPGSLTSNATSAGKLDVFISVLNNNGDFLWMKQFSGAGNATGASLALDHSNNIYITGGFQDTVDFDPGAGKMELTSAGSYDIFVAKLNGSGDLLWAKRMGGISQAGGSAITVDANGHIYLTGGFWGTADFDPGSGTHELTAAGVAYGDIFILRLDSGGNYVAAERFGGTYEDAGVSLAVDASGNIHTAGLFANKVDFDPGLDSVIFQTAGDHDIFILKMGLGTVGITKTNFGSQIQIYPNPSADGQVTIDLGRNYKKVNATIRTVTGQVVVSQKSASSDKLTLEIPGSSGIYVVEIRTGDGEVAYLKVVKQ